MAGRELCDDCGNVPLETMGECADCGCPVCDVCLTDAALTGYPGLCQDCGEFTAATDAVREARPGEFADDDDDDDDGQDLEDDDWPELPDEVLEDDDPEDTEVFPMEAP